MKLVILLFLLFSVSIGIFLLQKEQIFKPKANQNNVQYNLGVLVIKYFPLTPDGQNIDLNVTGDVGEPYTLIRQNTIDITARLKTSLENASKYLGYMDAGAVPSLIYTVVDTKEYTEAAPMLSDGTRRPDYRKIMSDHNICDWVENRGVREVWLWAYQGSCGPIACLSISESKMAGPFGDISNSPRSADMPVCRNSYRVYTFNYGRGTAEAMESWGHQMESEMDAVDRVFFRDIFQGRPYPQTAGVTGRCGSVHNPPNARNEYDRGNPAPNQSDCLDWNPEALGQLSAISCQNWGCADRSDSDNSSLNYMVWNWQNLPGRGNTRTYQGQALRNFWDIHGDFDRVMASDKTIFLTGQLPVITPTPTPSLTPSPSPSPSPVPTPTPTPVINPSPSPSPVPTPTPTPVINPSPSPTPVLRNRFDLNGDSLVNSFDASYLFAHWRQGVIGSQEGDFNLDFVINSFDYSLLRREIFLN